MSIALDLFVRELALMLLVGALGSGLVAFLPREVPALARVALAPVFGLALSAALLASVTEVMTTHTAARVVLHRVLLAEPRHPVLQRAVVRRYEQSAEITLLATVRS